MMLKARIHWKDSMAFSGTTPSGHNLVMDAGADIGGKDTGPRPPELLLFGVAGCTGIDIVSILKKMRYEPDKCHMTVEGERAEEHPKEFTKIHIHYVLEGDLPEDKVVRAIELSKDKYCTVAHSLKAEITAAYTINGVEGKK